MPLVDYSQVFIPLIVLLLSLTIHEAAHAWSADILGDPTPAQAGRLSLNPAAHVGVVGGLIFPLASFVSGFAVLGWSRPVPLTVRELAPRPVRRLLLISASGPASNLALALVAAGMIRLGAAATGSGVDLLSADLLFRAVDINILLVILNLLPVPPLDAGNLLAALWTGEVATAMRRGSLYGIIVLFALVLSDVLPAVLDPVRALLMSVLL